MDEASQGPAARHERFAAAHRQADWTTEELWISYLTIGGTLSTFDLEAYLAGLTPMPPLEQDVLACALNNRLWDLYQTIRVPYLLISNATPNGLIQNW